MKNESWVVTSLNVPWVKSRYQ